MKNVDENLVSSPETNFWIISKSLTGLLSLINSLFIKRSSFARFNEKTWECNDNIVYEFCQD